MKRQARDSYLCHNPERGALSQSPKGPCRDFRPAVGVFDDVALMLSAHV